MRWAWKDRSREERARTRWEPPCRCPLDGECLSKVVPPLRGEICECGDVAVVVIIGIAGSRKPLCSAKWRRS
jgi:hypothetical protein